MAYRRRARLLLEMLEPGQGVRILDAGCGEGFYLAAISDVKGDRPVGIDADAGRVRRAVDRLSGTAAAGDLRSLPFADGSFDGVLMSEVLEHVEDDRRALGEAFRVLAPGGILAISVPHASFPFWWDPFGRIVQALGLPPMRSGPLVGIWTGHLRLYHPEELADRVRDAGFQIERCIEATHHSFPFAHFLLYGIGKPLIEHGLLPARLQASASRFEDSPAEEGPLNPVRLIRTVLAAADRRNDLPARRQPKTFVNVVLKARKP